MILEAAQTALEQKDSAALTFVMAHCGNDARLQERVNGMIATLKN